MQKKCPRRWLAHCALAIAAGIFLGIRLETPLIYAVASFAALLGIGITRCRYFVPIFFFFLGITLCCRAAHPALPPEGKYTVNARVQGEATIRETDGRIALYLKDAKLRSESGSEYTLNGLYWTYWPEEEGTPLFDGQRVMFDGKLYHPEGKRNPHGFDFKLYLLQKGVQAGVSGAENMVRLPAGQTTHRDVFLRVRLWLEQRLDLLLKDQSPLAKALLIGNVRDIPDEMREGFRRAGVAHVLSVSGLHVMLIVGLMIWLLDRMYAPPWVMLAAVFLLLVPYSLLTGAKAPVIRAGVLAGYQLYARVARRRWDAVTGCSLGALIILLFHPLQLFDAGFQMSFGAVLGMILLGDALRRGIGRIRREGLRKVIYAYSVALCAALGAALPVICTYNSFSLMGLLVNPAVCLMTELLLLSEIFLLAVSFLSLPFAVEAGEVIAHLSRFVTEGVGKAGSISWASTPVPTPAWYLAAAIILCLLLCTRYIRMSGKRRILTGASAFVLSMAVLLCSYNSNVRYIQFSMGDADAAVLLDGDETVIIDTGEYGSDLSNYLLAEGRRADQIILTHLHTDHALGLEYLLKDHVPIGCIYLSTEALKTQTSEHILALLDMARERGIAVHEISEGDEITTARTKIRVLWPLEGTGHALKDANDCALALLISMGDTDILHMSDVTGTYEKYCAIPAEILRVAHHGSQNSSKEDFLNAVRPGTAIVSCNALNEKTYSRLANAGAMVYDTDKHGALTVTVREKGYSLQGYIR
ncbi:MAG: ComEC/Rec2 family competence protein [Clostridia bacterium]|nr:ComEC/Rec2 family competence protein [Clostridia bacterium]